MSNRQTVSISKFLSLVLRHKPGLIDLTLDAEGWADIDQLLQQAGAHGRPLTREQLEDVVAHNDKQRFSLSQDGLRIRANQGHSIAVDLNLAPQTPPSLLFHGTARHFLTSIQARGLVKGRRQYVHLSKDETTARAVGQRHGAAVILPVAAGRMAENGFLFFLSDNGVWLTDSVPPEFITFPS